ncbi:MAG: alkaline phosphatase family protein, partial [Phycisphaerales bacterium]
MRTIRLLLSLLVVMALAARGTGQPAATDPKAAATTLGSKTRNVVLVMLDGLRWQEVFGGADEAFMTKEVGNVTEGDRIALTAEFVRPTPQEKRAALMPFLWDTVAERGAVFGNRGKGSEAAVANPFKVSYPGYSEVLTGVVDDTIKDNRKRPNPQMTVFERLASEPAFQGRAAAFGAWDVFPFIFNTDRSGIPV